MMLTSEKKFGQSEYDLILAVLFSFLLHAAVVFVAIFVHISMFPEVIVPPAYQVKLVGLPEETVSAREQPKTETATAPAPPLPKKEVMPAAEKPSRIPNKAAPKKEAMPKLGDLKEKPVRSERTDTDEATSQKSPAVTPASAKGTSAAGAMNEGVAVISQPDFKDTWYLNNMSTKIRRNWNPPPDSKDAMARVIFKVNRSGRVIAIEVDNEHTTGTEAFKLAARRAIQQSDPFPHLPEDFYKPSIELSVDLIPAR
jgi:outer membrane biosynthesis protein TonB